MKKIKVNDYSGVAQLGDAFEVTHIPPKVVPVLCEICGRQNTRKDGRVTPLIADRNREGKTRGYLCTKCNVMLSCVRDDARLLQLAIDYLSKSG